MLMVISLLFSKFMLTIAMTALFATALWSARQNSLWQKFINDRVALAFTSVFILYLLSGINSQNTTWWMERMRIKLPFAILPFAFCVLFPLPQRLYRLVLATVVMGVLAGAVYSTIHYFQNSEAIHAGYKIAKTMKTPMDHIRFSLVTALATFIAFNLYEKPLGRTRVESYFWLGASIFLAVFLHLLSVRSGLAGFYLALLYMLFHQIAIAGHWKRGLLLAVVLITLPLLAYRYFPTLQEKANYMRYDLEQYFTHRNISGYSDGGRLLSQELAIKSIRDHMWTGVGVGDVKDEMHRLYEQYQPDIPRENQLVPHNQFLFVWMGLGLPGLVVFCVPLILVVFDSKNYRHFLFMAAWIITLSSFMTEPVLEIQRGTGVFIFFILLLHYQHRSEAHET